MPLLTATFILLSKIRLFFSNLSTPFSLSGDVPVIMHIAVRYHDIIVSSPFALHKQPQDLYRMVGL